jgi:perosamine synthetase
MAKRFIPWAKPVFFGNEKKYLIDAFDSTWISGGAYVDRFEKEFASHIGSPYCAAVSNGTTALQLAIAALGIRAGDEIIVPGFSFVAAANMAANAGAIPVYADIDRDSWCMDPVKIEAKITNKTKALIVVHNYGNVSDMDVICQLAAKHKLILIEDAAESVFSRYNGKFAGTFGDVGCFSFQATKTLTMGEGGAVTVKRKDLYAGMRKIRDHGMDPKMRYWHDVRGFNFRLTNLQAAIGCGQLEKVKDIILAKEKVFKLYSKYLENITGIKFQYFSKKIDPVVWTVAVRLENKAFKKSRDEIMKSLLVQGIETRPGFYPFSAMPLYHADPLPVSEFVSPRVICLPSFCTLSEEDVEYICGCIKSLKK